jgi:hypothetical protein
MMGRGACYYHPLFWANVVSEVRGGGKGGKSRLFTKFPGTCFVNKVLHLGSVWYNDK